MIKEINDTENNEFIALEDLQRLKSQRSHTKLKPLSTGEKISDFTAKIVGSWAFIIIQGFILAAWIAVNVISHEQGWDPYPFILLNLVLSFQAAFTAPIIMMSQNRQNAIDRQSVENDYNVNIKAELEIELLHKKLDLLKEQEIKELIGIIRDLEQKITKN